MQVAASISAAMERKGVTAPELARRANINRTGVYDIISGKSQSPRLDTVAKIAAALNVPVTDLLDGKDADDLRDGIVQLYLQLPEDKRKLLLQTAQAWSDT